VRVLHYCSDAEDWGFSTGFTNLVQNALDSRNKRNQRTPRINYTQGCWFLAVTQKIGYFQQDLPMDSPISTLVSIPRWEFAIISSSTFTTPFFTKSTVVDPPNLKYPFSCPFTTDFPSRWKDFSLWKYRYKGNRPD